MIKAFVVAFFFFRDWYCSSNTLQHFPSNRQPLNINNRNMVLLGLTVQSQLHNITATPHFRVPTWQIWLLLLVISSFFTSLALVSCFSAVCSLVSPICHSAPGRSRRQTQKGCLRFLYEFPLFQSCFLNFRNFYVPLHSRKPYFFSEKARNIHHQKVQTFIELEVAALNISCQGNSWHDNTCRQNSMWHSKNS